MYFYISVFFRLADGELLYYGHIYVYAQTHTHMHKYIDLQLHRNAALGLLNKHITNTHTDTHTQTHTHRLTNMHKHTDT